MFLPQDCLLLINRAEIIAGPFSSCASVSLSSTYLWNERRLIIRTLNTVL